MKKCSNVPNMWLDWRCCVGVVGHCQTALLFFFFFELCNHMVMCYAAQIITICGEEKYLTCLKMNMYLIYTSCLPFYIFSSCTYIFIKNIILENSLHISNLHFKRDCVIINTDACQTTQSLQFIYLLQKKITRGNKQAKTWIPYKKMSHDPQKGNNDGMHRHTLHPFARSFHLVTPTRCWANPGSPL